MTPARPARVGIYTRISQREEAAGDSIERSAPSTDRQEDFCRKRVKRQGWTVVGVYCDEGRSAWKQTVRRQQFERLCEDVKAGAVDVILAWTDDRLWRHPKTLERLVDLVDATGVRIVFDQGSEVELNTAQGLATARMLATMGAFESHRKSERASGKSLAMASQGVYFGGGRSFGWTREQGADGKYRETKPHPVESPILAELVERAANGESLSSLCEDLNARGVATAGAAKAWGVTALKRTLINPRHIGRRVHQGHDFGDAEWGAIVDVATWHRCVARLTDPARRHTRRPRRYVLSGLLRCSKCGGRMSGNVLHGVPCYRCTECARTRIVAASLEDHITETVFDLVGDAGFARRLRVLSGTGRDAEGEIRKIEAEMDELAALVGSGAMTAKQFATANALLIERRDQATSDAAAESTGAVVGRFAGQIDDLRAAWASWGDAEVGLDRRRALLASVIEGIVILPGTMRGGGRSGPKPLDLDRVEVTWKV